MRLREGTAMRQKLNTVAQAADVPNTGMTGDLGDLYDVVVLGPVEATPSAEARLAAALAGLNGNSLIAIAQGLAEKKLSMGLGLDRVTAEALLQQLQSLGALASISRAIPPAFPPSRALTPGPLAAFRPRGTPFLTPLHGLASTAPPSSPGSAPGSAAGLRPLGSLRLETFSSAPAVATQSARVETSGIGNRVPAAAAMARFGQPDPAADSLELDRGFGPGERGRSSNTVAGASGLYLPKMTVSQSGSGLELAGEKGSSFAERCARHGLLFDRRKSSSCRKCLADGRAVLGKHPGDGLRAHPARRALLGLLFALVLGFLPAAYYSRQVVAVEVDRLRTEQRDLSRGPGNDKRIRRFDEIEQLLAQNRHVTTRNTLIIWLAASGVLLVSWYRLA
jgi:hypothetical protein